MREAFKNDLQKTFGIFHMLIAPHFHFFPLKDQEYLHSENDPKRPPPPTYRKFHIFFADHF